MEQVIRNFYTALFTVEILLRDPAEAGMATE
jgi:hypothetical protein